MRHLLLPALFLLLVLKVAAHPILQNPVWIEAAPEKVTLKLDVSVRELIVVQKLETAEDGSVEVELAAEYAERHRGYLLDHFTVKADGKVLTGTIIDIRPPKRILTGLEGVDRSHFRYTIDYPLSAPPAVLSFVQTMCKEFPSAPGVPWDLSYAYRYGPPGQTPLKFGALVRDQELSFNTGFPAVKPADGTPSLAAPSLATRAMPVEWAVLWLLFAAALGLNTGLRTIHIQTAAVLWLGAYLGAEFLALPSWLLIIGAGAATILAAVDNIYTWAGDTPPLRRRALLLAGSLCFGLALSQVQPHLFSGARQWMALLVILPLVNAAAAFGLRRFCSRKGEAALRGAVQLTSLAITGTAIWLMLRLLEVLR